MKTFLKWATERNYYFGKEHLKFKAQERPLTIIALTETELNQLFEHDFLKKRDQQIRDIFYFNCNSGLRFIDLKDMTMDHIKNLSYPKGKKEVNVLPKCDLISSHTARKTFVTLAHEKGMPDEDIMHIAGIRNQSTLRRYLEISDQHIKSTMEKHLG